MFLKSKILFFPPKLKILKVGTEVPESGNMSNFTPVSPHISPAPTNRPTTSTPAIHDESGIIPNVTNIDAQTRIPNVGMTTPDDAPISLANAHPTIRDLLQKPSNEDGSMASSYFEDFNSNISWYFENIDFFNLTIISFILAISFIKLFNIFKYKFTK